MTEERDVADGDEDAAGGPDGDGDAAPGPDGDEDAASGPDADQDPAGLGERERDPAGLGERERDLLAVERRSWPGPGAKERAVRERLGLSPTRYYQLLNALLDDPRALAHDPVTVNRLRRVREEKRSRR
ncbi:DUF3263 domain-containing protein [Streptomyces venezuelae]|uniref:DUF3263 domain-containing protein n=1 Tax=Streptomyces venezuelae TaxID=54571 RepID=UPI00278C5F29|nr:DUF3263 domain-containing protein [Streptomyces venezuelae]